jgi:hypothetical protein
MKTPVVFIIFNRPDQTKRVFEAIRAVQPSKLFVIADGPREEKLGEAEKCAATRAVINGVDWQCELITNYSDINLGCKKRVSSGIGWVFEQVEAAIILEDDCLPDYTFFSYCEHLLEKYRDDARIMAISGDNFQFGRRRTEDSYYFSRYNYIWGWASWRRSWQHYDVDIKLWNTVCEGNWLKDILNDDSAVEIWRERLQSVDDGKIDTWDYQWVLACWLQNGLTIVPNVNLISNIGFGIDATHTTDRDNKLANLPIQAMYLPLQHPKFVVCDSESDNYASRNNIYI